MKLYDFQGKISKYKPPKLLYRGLDPSKNKKLNGLDLINEFFEKKYIPSTVLSLEEGRLTIEDIIEVYRPGFEEQFQESINISKRMLKEEFLDPNQINDKLRWMHGIFLPTCFISTSIDLKVAARYSHYAKNPVLIFNPENLEGLDFRHDSTDGSKEIAIFKKIPVTNMVGIIYFYENPKEIKKILKKVGREDIRLIKGYKNPDWRYKTCSGEMRTDISLFADQKEEYIEFYNCLQRKISTQNLLNLCLS